MSTVLYQYGTIYRIMIMQFLQKWLKPLNSA